MFTGTLDPTIGLTDRHTFQQKKLLIRKFTSTQRRIFSNSHLTMTFYMN